MAGISTGPSMGFMGRLKQNLPGAMNMIGRQMPGPWGQAAGITGSLIKKPMIGGNTNGGPTNAGVQGQQTTQQNGPGGMPPTGPTPHTNGLTKGMPPNRGGGMFSNGLTPQTGMVRGPSMPMPMPGGVSFDPGMRNGNTGFAGGMSRGPIQEPGPGMFGTIGGPGMMQPQPAPYQQGGISPMWQAMMAQRQLY